MSIVSDPAAVERLVRRFIAFSLEHGGADVAAEATRVARLLGGQDAAPLARWLFAQVPELTEAATDPVSVVEHALAGGALAARDLLDQCGADVERAQSLIYLFTKDWTGLFTGLPMPRQWIKKQNVPPPFEDRR